MKHWDQGLPAVGIDLQVWADPQGDPNVVSANGPDLVVEFDCYEKATGTTRRYDGLASYRGRISFTEVGAYRWMDGELSPYNIDFGEYQLPPCFFEVDYLAFAPDQIMSRDPSWYPRPRNEDDPQGFFSSLDDWNPVNESNPPSLPGGLRHFLVSGHDSYVEVAAKGYTFERVARENAT